MKKWILVLFVMALATTGPIDAESADREVTLEWGVKISMRDGVNLNATVFRPKDLPEPLPVVFTLTPYTSDSELQSLRPV